MTSLKTRALLLALPLTLLVSTTVYAHSAHREDITKNRILNHYSNIALAVYGDSLTTAKFLHTNIKTFLKSPTQNSLNNAKQSWLAARIPYMQSEAFRFGNAIVDDWEGKVNAWPLDEGLIDYVADSYGSESEENPLYTANVIGNTSFKLSGEIIDATHITPILLEETLHEIDGIEANVATGYHAIEFLLWGQDLNGTDAGAGNRPATDFDTKNCTSGNCDRRAQYLLTVSELLVHDLEWMSAQWQEKGAARITLLENENAGISAIFTGMGSLSYGELAGERIKLGVLLHDPEEEHDCFSDNTHNSHYYDIKGIQNIYTGEYLTTSGKQLSGPSLSNLIASKNKEANQELLAQLENSLNAAQKLIDSTEKDGIAYDQLLAEGNTAGNAKILNVVSALLAQTKGIEKAVNVLGFKKLEVEGSDALDSPTAVFQ